MMRDWFSTRLARWSIAVVYTATLTLYLLQPESTLVAAGLPAGEPSVWRELIFSVGHVLGFGGLAFVWQRVAVEYWRLQRALLITATGTIIYGILIEYAQATVPGRSAQLSDMLANALGVVIVLMLRLQQQRRNHHA